MEVPPISAPVRCARGWLAADELAVLGVEGDLGSDQNPEHDDRDADRRDGVDLAGQRQPRGQNGRADQARTLRRCSVRHFKATTPSR